MIKTAQVWGSQSQRFHLTLCLFLHGSPQLPDKPPFYTSGHQHDSKMMIKPAQVWGLQSQRYHLTLCLFLHGSPQLPDKPPFYTSGHQHDSKMMIKTAQVWGSQSQRYHLGLFLFLAVLSSRTSPHFVTSGFQYYAVVDPEGGATGARHLKLDRLWVFVFLHPILYQNA